MIAAIFSKNQSTRIGIETHLRQLQFSQIYVFTDRHDLTHHLSKEKTIPDIVIFDLLDADEFSFRLFPASTSILLLVQESEEALKSKHSILTKPFGLPALADGIQECMMKSSHRRNHLLIIGDEHSYFIESTARLHAQIHWSDVLFCNSNERLKQLLKQDAQKIGGILVSGKINPAIASTLWRWKRSSDGLDTVLGSWGTEEEIFPIRTSVDLVWSKDDISEDFQDKMIISLSENSQHLKAHRLLVLRTNRLIWNQSFHKAEKMLSKALKTCPSSPKILQQLGRTYLHLKKNREAREKLSASIQLNPCLPNTYVELMASLETTELPPPFHSLAKRFCPHHSIGLTHV